jgi:hypothetical protein
MVGDERPTMEPVTRMSRLDSFIRRLQAQRACIDAAAHAIEQVPGLVVELGLGNGRTYDHLCKLLPERRIVVFERDPQPHPDCWPGEEDLIIGDLNDTLPDAARRWPRTAALVHSDIGTGDPVRNHRVAAALSRLLPPLLVDGGIVVSDQQLTDPSLESVAPPAGVAADRYFIYRRR